MTEKPSNFPPLLLAGIVAGGVTPILLHALGFTPASAATGANPLPVCPLTLLEQWLAVLTAFAIKPAYMGLSLALIVWLWRSTADDLTALRRGLIAFLAGESACALNYLVFDGRSDLWEFLHSYGMVVSFSFVAYAGLEGLDHRLIRFSAPKDRCAALSLCRACIKHADVPCGLRRLFTFGIPSLIVVAFIPLTANLKEGGQLNPVLGSLVNYSPTLFSQWFEFRYCAALAIGLFSVSWLVLLKKRNDPVSASKVWLAAGLGPLGFGTTRLFLISTYSDQLMWSAAWEEVTELLFVAFVAVALWLFRHRLVHQPTAAATPTPPPPGAA
jgi:hypothetical protein